METLVLPAQDHHWHSPCSKSFIASAPSSPLYRSASSAAAEFTSPQPLARSLSNALAAASPIDAAKGRASSAAKNRSKNNRGKDPSRPKPGFGRKIDPRRKEDDGSPPPPPRITILQRPQSKEAAMLDLAKITGLPLSEVYAKNGLPLPAEKKPPVKTKEDVKNINISNNNNDARINTTTVSKMNNNAVKVRDELKKGQFRKTATVCKAEQGKPETKVVKNRMVKLSTTFVGLVDEEAKVNPANVKAKVGEKHAEVRAKNVKGGEKVDVKLVCEKAVKEEQLLSSKCLEGFLFEKWAGPAFTNSPPPSSLPIPNFSSLKKQQRPGMVPPVELSQQMIDTEAATKGLRRILNLDF